MQTGYRGIFGAPRPPFAIPLPPAPMPSRLGLTPLKAWRYVGIYGADFLICAAQVRIGPARQSFYAVWDRRSRRLIEHTGHPNVRLATGALQVLEREVQIDISLHEGPGIEVVTDNTWTRKQGGIAARGRLMLDGQPHAIEARAIVDDSAGYHPRHTAWQWCAGVGVDTEGHDLAWNLVTGVHPRENTVWVDGAPTELPEPQFADDLSAIGELTFSAESERAANENRVLVRSRYRQPFGTFGGSIGGHTLAEGYGVTEEHDVYW